MKKLIIIAALVSVTWSQPLTNKGGDPCPGFDNFERGEWTLNRAGFDYTDNYQLPLIPEQSVDCIYTPEGYRAELWASENTEGAEVRAVMSFAWDEKGRMWVGETLDYPNELKSQYQGNDRVRILEDTDGDGVADKSTIFVEGLNILQGITFTVEGVLVLARPHVILYKDEDGDDKADTDEGTIILTGFNGSDTHGGIGNLTYGLDNMIYASNGYNSRDITGDNLQGTVRINQGPLRFNQDGSGLEDVSDAGCNSWAVSQNEEGQIFFNSATCGRHIQHSAYIGHEQNISVHGEEIRVSTIEHNQGDWQGSYTAVSNSEIYTSRYFHEKFWNASAFVLDGTVHQAHIDFLTPKGSTWEADEEEGWYNILVGEDAWVAPIMAKVGPDGAVWISDWYNYLYLHNGAQPAGAGAAVLSEVRDNTMNRIYRVVREDAEPYPVIDISGFTPAQLVKQFNNPTMLYRLHAQRLLLRSGLDAELEGLLEEALASRSSDVTGLDPEALHAIWTLHGFGVFESNPTKWNPILKDLLLHPSHSVRMNVMKAMPRTIASAEAIRDQGRVNDPNAHVRVWALAALGEMPDASGTEIFSDYRNLDDISTVLSNRAGGLTTVNTMPDIPDLHEIVKAEGHKTPVYSHFDLALNSRGKIVVEKIVGSPSGIISIYQPDGRKVRQLNIIDGQITGSNIPLNKGMYLFSFSGTGKQSLQGKLINIR